MNLAKSAVFAVATLLLGGGYLASQWAFFRGDPSRYAEAIGSPAVRAVALVVLVACVVSASLAQRENQA